MWKKTHSIIYSHLSEHAALKPKKIGGKFFSNLPYCNVTLFRYDFPVARPVFYISFKSPSFFLYRIHSFAGMPGPSARGCGGTARPYPRLRPVPVPPQPAGRPAAHFVEKVLDGVEHGPSMVVLYG